MSKTRYFSKKSKGGKKTRRRRSRGGEDTREDTMEDLNKERMVLVGGGLLLFDYSRHSRIFRSCWGSWGGGALRYFIYKGIR